MEPAYTAPIPTAPEPAESEIPWSYDEGRLLNAWRAGEWSGLAEQDREILEICQNVMQQAAAEAATDYERELFIHDWMLDWASYDSNTLSNLPDFQPTPHHDNPYGFLTAQKGICLGYSSTFQLFMDLLGIPCITVEGLVHGGTADHAWNMVQMDGQWYCVDVTWDDPTTRNPVSLQYAHRYFNVTSDYLREHDHQWNEESVPEAAATDYAWSRV